MTTSKEKQDNQEKKPLRLSRPSKLELKKTVETGQVRQSFSHGRSKSVTVEVKRSRTFERGESGRMTEVKAPEHEEVESPAVGRVAEGLGERITRLSEEERAVRLRALEVAREEDVQRRRQEAEEAEQRRIREEERQRLEKEAERLRAEQEELRKFAEEERERAEASGAARPEVETPAAQEPPTVPETPGAASAEATNEQAAEAPPAAPAEEGESATGGIPETAKKKDPDAVRPPQEKRATEAQEDARARKKAPGGGKLGPTRKSPEERRRSGKLTISQALDEEGRQRSLASMKRRREKQIRAQRDAQQAPQKVVREVVVPESITVQELANRMAARGAEVVKTLMKLGVMATINQSIDADTAELVVEEFGHRLKRVSAADVEQGMRGGEDREEDLKARPPVVTVMGHVDHGKTSLLDALRATDVAGGETGGITQHIGAYQVRLESGRITFVDTPGHAAFTEMRSRGAKVTDIVILVVAADDGIMEQTVEAINHAKAAEVPMVVAVNKVDKPGADPDRVKQELLQHGIVVEDLGGDTLCIPVSAKERMNLERLEEAILLQAELLELKANPNRPAEGVVIEAKLERGRGAVATVLVQRGTLHVGDIFVAGSEWGRVRALMDDRGETQNEASPSVPVEVLGLNGTPLAGDEFVVVENETRAREVSEYRQLQKRESDLAKSTRGTLEQMMTRIKEGEARELPVVVKSDVHGSLEAIVSSLEKLSTDEVKAAVLHAAVGGVNESDVTLAGASNAMIIAFNVRANPQARELARRDGVEIRTYSIIYDVVDDLRAMLSGLLAPAQREQILGYAEIRQVFTVTKAGKVAGCMVTEGVVRRGARVRLLRDDVVIHDGKLKTLRRFKEEVKEVRDGYECGMAFENYGDIQEGDQIECYEVEEVAREL